LPVCATNSTRGNTIINWNGGYSATC